MGQSLHNNATIFQTTMRTDMKQWIGMVTAGLIGGAAVLGGQQWLAPSSQHTLESPQYQSRLARQNVAANAPSGLPTDFVAAAEKGMPAVVHITSKVVKEDNKPTNRQPNLFDFFNEMPFEIPQGGTGSGVIIRSNGYIVTNNHVVDEGNEFEVTLFDNRKFNAKLIGKDETTDLAVLKIDAKELPTLELANSDEIKVGEWVLAVGNPFDLTSTVTAGIVSAIGRNIDILKGQYKIESFIQTDAAVNPGNSGGALLDTEGNLVGINTAIASRTGAFAGYSFAIPSNIMTKVVEDLIQHGEVKRGFLGVSIQDMDATVASDLGLNITEGVFILEVAADGAAEAAGIQKSDVIVAVNGRRVKNSPKLQELIGRKRPGDQVTITVHRKGKEQDISVTLKG